MKRNLLKRALALALAALLACAGTAVYAATNETEQKTGGFYVDINAGFAASPEEDPNYAAQRIRDTDMDREIKNYTSFNALTPATISVFRDVKAKNHEHLDILRNASGSSGGVLLGGVALGENGGETRKPTIDVNMSLEAFEKNYGTLYEAFLRVLKWFDECEVLIGNSIGQKHPSYKSVYDGLGKYDIKQYYKVGKEQTDSGPLFDREALNKNQTVGGLLTQVQRFRTLLDNIKDIPKINEDCPDFSLISEDVDALLEGLYGKNNSADIAPGYLNPNVLLSFPSKDFGDKSSQTSTVATVFADSGLRTWLRSAPDGKRLSLHSDGTSVSVLERGDEWCKVRIGDQVGYMATRFLRFAANSADPEAPIEDENKSLPSSLDEGGFAANYAMPAPKEVAVNPPVDEISNNSSDSGDADDPVTPDTPTEPDAPDGDDNPGDDNPGDDNPGDDNPGDDTDPTEPDNV